MPTPKKKRKSSSDSNLVDYLSTKNENENSLKKEQLEFEKEKLKLEKEKFQMEREERLQRLEIEKAEKQQWIEVINKLINK